MSKWVKLQRKPKFFFKNIFHWYKKFKKTVYKTNICTNDQYLFNPHVHYTHLLHTGENLTGLNHLDLWIPQFLNANIHFVVLVRNLELFTAVKKKYSQVTLIYAKTQSDITLFLDQMNYLKVCFYSSNTGNNIDLLTYIKLTHIFIGHGDSDKSASAHKFFRVYDQNWVAGNAHIDRFKNAEFDCTGLEHIKVGRPNLKKILLSSHISWRERFNRELKILYLTTWEGFINEQNYTSAYIIEDFFHKIKKYDFIKKINIKFHPKLGIRDKSLENFKIQLKKRFESHPIEITLYENNIAVEKLIQQSNIFICDISAVISESLAANAPIFVYTPKNKKIQLSQSQMKYEDYTYTFSSIEELIQQLQNIIVEENDFLASKREKAIQYILGKNETLNDTFTKMLKKYAE